mmetsp:Transcript_3434/g.12243  ORF Transcript_3434/g.12243 Transcript_3434/m.12243 type:complete len:245 (-) Transcript_3434:198-932(-)
MPASSRPSREMDKPFRLQKVWILIALCVLSIYFISHRGGGDAERRHAVELRDLRLLVAEAQRHAERHGRASHVDILPVPEVPCPATEDAEDRSPQTVGGDDGFGDRGSGDDGFGDRGRGGDDGAGAARGDGRGAAARRRVRATRRPAAAHPRRKGRHGRPRPRRQRDSVGLCGPGLRRRRRPALPPPRRGGAAGHRRRRPRRRRLVAGGRARHPCPAAHHRARGGRRGPHRRRCRRRDSQARLF